MKLTFDVPEAAQRSARRALALHRDSPLADVGGLAVAETLASGVATLDVVGKVHRFFAVNGRVYAAESQALHTEHDSPVVRSWLLHGAEAAQRWAEGVYRQAVREGYRPADAVTDLMGRHPDEIYAAFSLGAWRFEYDLDPRKAARFVEEYHRATGWNLDLHRAFGESAPAVGNALQRRFHPIDPFREAARCLTVEDVDYRLAAQVDLAELTDSLDALEEGLKPSVFNASATVTAKAVWPAFVAYVILAAERPELIVAMNKGSQKPPLLAQKPKAYTQYHDAINTYVTFFHPGGSRFIDPKKADPNKAKTFGTIPEEMEDLLVRAYFGRTVHPVQAQKLLGKARRWTAENKFAGSLFHVFNADWKKGNWQHILDNIPDDADVRPYFQEFVKANPMPAEGVKLQQTLSDKSLKADVAQFLGNLGVIEDGTPDFLDPVKVDDTLTGEAAAKIGTPLGVYSLLDHAGNKAWVLGAFKTNGGVHYVLRIGAKFVVRYDSTFAQSFTSGETKVLLAHKDMPGSHYSGKSPVSPEPASATTDQNIAAPADPQDQTPALAPTKKDVKGKGAIEPPSAEDDAALEYLATQTEFDLNDFQKLDAPASLWGKVVQEVFGIDLTDGMHWRYVTADEGKKYKFIGAWLDLEGDEHYVFRFLGGSLDGTITKSASGILITKTKALEFVPRGWTPPAAEPVKQTPPPEEKPADAEEPHPFQFFNDEVVDWGGSRYVVVGTATDLKGNATYLAQHLGVVNERVPELTPGVIVATELHKTGKFVVSLTSIGGQTLPQRFPWPPSANFKTTISTAVQAVPFEYGDALEYQGQSWTVGGRTDAEGEARIILVRKDNQQNSTPLWEVTDAPLVDLLAVYATSSYNPPEDAPENPNEDDEPDPEQGTPEMSGTQVAFDYIAKKGWKPAVASENSLFQFPLGGRQLYGASSKTRTVIGYALTEGDTPMYVHVTEQGNIGWVTCQNAHAKYGPLDEMIPALVDALLPKPGEKKQVFPKLNYKLSSKAKEIAKANDLLYVKAPKESLYHVGTPLLTYNGQKTVLLGWVGPFSGLSGTALALLLNPGDPSGYYTASLHDLNANYSLVYESDTEFSIETGEITFGKKPGSDTLTVNTSTAFIPSDPPPGWDDPEPLTQPVVPAASKGKHISAGIIAIIPAGKTTVHATTGIHKVPAPCVVLYKPMGAYGGYKLSIPKGTIDKGQSILQTAVREFWEETGLTAKPVAYLGDFRANQSITRLYVGYVTGGSPYKKKQPEECDAVTFKPMSVGMDGGWSYKGEKWYGQLVPSSGNKWQQAAIDAAAQWLAENGSPETYQPEGETVDATVAFAQDVKQAADSMAGAFAAMAPAMQQTADALQNVAKTAAGLKSYVNPAGWKPSIPPKQVDAEDPWKALLFKADFPVTSTMVQVLKSKAHVANSVPVSFDCARKRPSGPEFGEVFQTSAGTPYIAAGYVSWSDTNGAVSHFLLVQTSAGSIDALPAVADGLASYKISSDQSLAAGAENAWYEHPDPSVNAMIGVVFKQGTLSNVPVNMKTFKEKWMKEAGLPAYAVVTSNMLRDVASLFVPGACSQLQRDTILLCLKSRMKATHSAKKTNGGATTVTTSAAAPAAPTPSAPSAQAINVALPPKVVLSTGPLSPILKQYVDHPQPHLFSATGKKVSGGSKPNMLLNGPGGKQWLAKYAVGEDFRAQIDRAAYKLCELAKPNNVPVGVMEFDGKLVSYQPFANNAATPPSSPSDLSDENMAELLAQHAVDMFMGDHDGHVGNWIEVEGRLIAVDRGQAFKFLLQNKPESLDPAWHAPGNFGDGYAKRLLLQWGKGEVEVPDMAWASMLKAIRGVQAITQQQLSAVLDPVFESLDTPLKDRQRVTAELLKRKNSYEKDWTKVLRGLRTKFAWPTVAANAAPAKVFTSSPKDVGFGKAQEKTIEEAIAAKWQGKSLAIGGLAFENQEVLVRRVMWEEKPGLKIPSTFLQFRISRPDGLKAAKKLYGSSNLEIAETLGGPQRLKADHQHGFWEKIYAAIKTINYHLFKEKDTKVNANTIAQMNGIVPTLNQLIAKTSDPSGVYAPTNEPNEAVYAMAEQYLQYAQIVNYWVDKKEELVGQHSPTLVEFLWEPPVPDHAIAKDAPPYKVSLKKQGALWPTAVPVGQDVHVTNLNKPVMNSGSQSQFVIEDPLTKARIYWNPPGGLTGQGLENVKDGVETLKGQGWAIIPGEPSAATVAHLLKLFQDATGISSKAATPEDDAVLYWSKQAAVLQGSGAVQPKNDHTTVVEPDYAAALAKYEQGDAKGATAALQQFVAKKLGEPVSSVVKLAKPADLAGQYTRGAGFRRHERIGWTRERLVKVMGANCHLAHRLSDSPVAWMQAMQSNGALLSNAIKAYYGVTKTGASPGQDMNVGGGQGLFACWRTGFANDPGMIYFDISIALRLDLYIVGTGDTYGNTGQVRYTTPEQWVKMGAHKKTGGTSASSHQQVSVRHEIDIQQYLVAVMCGNNSARDACIKMAKDMGWTFYGGATPEKVFRA